MLHLRLITTYGVLPTSEYELCDDDVVVGKIQIRHQPSCGVGIPEHMGSHVYFEIAPEHRSKGYGKSILSLGLEKAKEVGLYEIYLTCMEDNLASKRIIEHSGGVFSESVHIPEEGKNMLKYMIIL